MSNIYALRAVPSLLRPLLLLTFAATAVACSGGTGGDEGSDDPGINDPASPASPDVQAGAHGRSRARPSDDDVPGTDVPPSGDDLGDVSADDTDADVPDDADVADDVEEPAPPSVVDNDVAAPPPAEEPASAPPPSAGGSDAPVPNGWLYTKGNRILRSNGSLWQGKGANIADVRGCNACGEGAQDPDEVIRRVDMLVDEWGANFLRLTLESAGASGILTDETYLDHIEEIVDHIGSKPGVVVMIANWISPTFNEMGWPTAQTQQEWRKLAARFADDKHVMFGLVNEPEDNQDGAHDEEVWEAMNETVAAIREVEEEEGSPPHIITVQGTGAWARLLDYYVDHPITAGGGENIAYEVHVYDPATSFAQRFGEPSKTLPVIIGEFGPWAPYMNMNDTKQLIQQADAKKVSWLAWTFHMRCPPNLIEDTSGGSCGIDMPLKATPWGDQVKAALKKKKNKKEKKK